MRPLYKRLRRRPRHVLHLVLSAKGLSVCAGCICLSLSLSLYTTRARVSTIPSSCALCGVPGEPISATRTMAGSCGTGGPS
jgi:hypothetical protein